MYKIIIEGKVNETPTKKVNAAIKRLGAGWHVVSAETTVQIFGVIEEPRSYPPIHHACYVTTVVLRKD
jgi:hypothetical protein